VPTSTSGMMIISALCFMRPPDSATRPLMALTKRPSPIVSPGPGQLSE
jgi:hypothetical protein